MNWRDRPNPGDGEPRDAQEQDLDHALSDLSQSHSDADQTASDADAGGLDADRDASLSDESGSVADQHASDADQVAADQELAADGPQSTEQREQHAATRRFRASASRARAITSAERADTESERAQTQARRLETAAIRDEVALERDRSADLRDTAARRADRALLAAHPLNDELRTAVARHAEARDQGRVNRQRAATDRQRAAEDRIQAAAAERQARIEIQRAQLDGDTGVFARDLGHTTLSNEIDRCRRSREPFVLADVALDGVEEGDDVSDAQIGAVVRALREQLRSYDPVVRIAFGEFLCGIPGSASGAAQQRIRDIRDAVELGQDAGRLSVGIAVLEPHDTLSSLTERASVARRADRGQRRR